MLLTELKYKKHIASIVNYGIISIIILYLIIGNLSYPNKEEKSLTEIVIFSPNFSNFRNKDVSIIWIMATVGVSLSLICSCIFSLYAAKLCLLNLMHDFSPPLSVLQNFLVNIFTMSLSLGLYLLVFTSRSDENFDISFMVCTLIISQYAELLCPFMIYCSVNQKYGILS